MLTQTVEVRLMKREETKSREDNCRDNWSLTRTSKKRAMSGPNVNEAILSPTSTSPSDIFPYK